MYFPILTHFVIVDIRFDVDVLCELLNDADVLCESDSLLCIDADVESI